jgi:hypothetical protein
MVSSKQSVPGVLAAPEKKKSGTAWTIEICSSETYKVITLCQEPEAGTASLKKDQSFIYLFICLYSGMIFADVSR